MSFQERAIQEVDLIRAIGHIKKLNKWFQKDSQNTWTNPTIINRANPKPKIQIKTEEIDLDQTLIKITEP